MDSLLDFTSKVVVITGAAQGFGQLLAQSLADRGAKLVLGDINETKVKEVAEALSAKGIDAIGMKCDVSSNADCKAMVDIAVEKYGRVDIAVNNAGISQPFLPLHEIDESLMDQQFAVNVKGVQFGMRHQITQMLKQGEGNILNVSSRAGISAAASLGAYAAAKHAVIGLTKTAAVEYARHNIRVNAICPSFALTPMVTNVADQGLQNQMSKVVPMKRLGEPEEVVVMMVMMLSPANTYLTGQCISVDGGVSAA